MATRARRSGGDGARRKREGNGGNGRRRNGNGAPVVNLALQGGGSHGAFT